MKASAMAALLVAAVLGGCATGEGGVQNPNFAAPKLVLHPREDGNVTVFVHGAFREQPYEWVSLRVDNETVSNRSDVFSLEERVPSLDFFLEVRAEAADALYVTRALVQADLEAERVHVAFLDEGGWSEPRTYGTPYEHILDRERADA